MHAWVRNPRHERDVPICYGPDHLEAFLRQTEIAVCLFLLTRDTEGIFCARTFAMMPRGAMLANVGRGKHVLDDDLVAALDSGQLSYAAWDALSPEPLPPTSPLWRYPKVPVMPHMARWPTVAQLVTEIVANIRSIEAGGRPLQAVDIRLGYQGCALPRTAHGPQTTQPEPADPDDETARRAAMPPGSPSPVVAGDAATKQSRTWEFSVADTPRHDHRRAAHDRA